jgi:hypothetical protein
MTDNSRRMTSATDVRDFLLAGKSTVTLRSTKTQKRFTYRVRKSEDGRVWFVALLNGPDNESSYGYIGIIRAGKTFEHGRKSKVAADAPSVKAFAWFFANLAAGERLGDGVEVWHEGKCGRCGRKLTVPESIAHGIGPECIKHVHPSAPDLFAA